MKTIHFSLITIPLIVANAAFAQGSLTPPGPPKPTMKTLEQIEPRIDVQHRRRRRRDDRSLGEFQLLSQPAFLLALTRTERSYGLEGPDTNGERLDIAPRWGAGICL